MIHILFILVNPLLTNAINSRQMNTFDTIITQLSIDLSFDSQLYWMTRVLNVTQDSLRMWQTNSLKGMQSEIVYSEVSQVWPALASEASLSRSKWLKCEPLLHPMSHTLTASIAWHHIQRIVTTNILSIAFFVIVLSQLTFHSIASIVWHKFTQKKINFWQTLSWMKSLDFSEKGFKCNGIYLKW